MIEGMRYALRFSTT